MCDFFPAATRAGMDGMPDILAGPLRARLATANADPEWGAACAHVGQEWAREADEYYRAVATPHPTRQPLIRVGVKDNIDCEGFPTRLGSRRYRHYPQRSAEVLTRIPAENITCKTQLTEVTLGIDAGCRNPLFPGGWPGASSTGSGVSVAANICDISIGTDSLGSVRFPAVACGVVSLRSAHDPALLRGVLPMSPSLDAVGWFARTVDDLRLAAQRFTSLRPAAPPGGRRPRLALVTEVLSDDLCDQRVLRDYESYARRAEASGIEVLEVSLGEVWKVRLASWALCARESYEMFSPYAELLEPLGEDVRNVMRLGQEIPPSAAEELRSRLPSLREDAGTRLARLAADVLVMPVAPFVLPSPEEVAAWPMIFPDVRDPAAEALAGYAPVASILGWPALTVPVRRDAADSPRQAGVQLLAPPGSEFMLMDLAEKTAA